MRKKTRPLLPQEKFDQLCVALSAAYAAAKDEDPPMPLLRFQVRLGNLYVEALRLREKHYPQKTARQQLAESWRAGWAKPPRETVAAE